MSAPLSKLSEEVAPSQKKPTLSEDRLLHWIGRLILFGSVGLTGLAGFIFLGPLWVTYPVFLILVTMLGLMTVLEPSVRGWRAERQVRRLLRRHELRAVHDVFLSAPDGRRAQLDHVVFLGQRVAVIETKSVTGLVARRGNRWSRLVDGRERLFGGPSPQQQVMAAREVLMAAYPPWNQNVLALMVITHGTLGEGLEDSDWVVEIGHLAAALGRFRELPDGASERRWQDMARFLEANRRTRRDRMRFLRLEVLRPSNFARLQLLGLGSCSVAARRSSSAPSPLSSNGICCVCSLSSLKYQRRGQQTDIWAGKQHKVSGRVWWPPTRD